LKRPARLAAPPAGWPASAGCARLSVSKADRASTPKPSPLQGPGPGPERAAAAGRAIAPRDHRGRVHGIEAWPCTASSTWGGARVAGGLVRGGCAAHDGPAATPGAGGVCLRIERILPHQPGRGSGAGAGVVVAKKAAWGPPQPKRSRRSVGCCRRPMSAPSWPTGSSSTWAGNRSPR